MKNSKIYSEDVPLSAIYESEETPSVEPIPEYVPTQWVDDLEPDIDADHLNHIEDGIKRATDGVNNLIENGGGSFAPSDGYVFVEQEESEEDIPPVPEPMLDADALGGMPVTFFAPQNQIGDAFSEGRDYAAGDYCIRLNTLHKFTAPKPSGPWDASKVVACTVMEEVGELNSGYGTVIYKTGTARSAIKDYVKICDIQLLAGHSYLVLIYGELSISAADETYVIQLTFEGGTVNEVVSGAPARINGIGGGGGCAFKYVSCKTNLKAILEAYCTMDYDINGSILAIQLK